MKKKPKAPKPATASKPKPFPRAGTSSTENLSKWIRTERPLPLPGYVRSALQKLDDAGHIAYVVGGCVRDFLLGRTIKDYDIASSAEPDELCRLFPNAITVGKAFGVLKIPFEHLQFGETILLEIATFRKDLDYKDHRRPTSVVFTSADEDAKRRDFTINGLFYDSKTSRILDSVGGVDDLGLKILRAIGDPMERFKEDALRLLRAVRFTAALGFALDPATAEAIKTRAKLITKISPERIRDELTRMWTGPQPELALKLMSELGLLRHVLPELEALRGLKLDSPNPHAPDGDVWKHTLKVMDFMKQQNPSPPVTLAWGTLLHDIGKPTAYKKNSGRNFNYHEIDGARLAQQIGENFKFSRQEIDTIVILVETHLQFRDVFQMRESTLQRFIRQPHFEELLALHKADATVTDGNLIYHEFCASRLEELKKSASDSEHDLISGEDLIQLGLKPGPRFSQILRTVEDLALEKKLKSKEEALEYVIKHFVG